ncbi:MAG: carbohydrate ABC transporter substrate-binding protein, partial [Candidatus Competibacteraceae bacterium]|nr:carbohydrate ABC transporter substrate-binding protein [Candidatus Competibacteraceae bacterium]
NTSRTTGTRPSSPPRLAGGAAPDLIQIIQTRLVEFGSKNDMFVDFAQQTIVDYKLWDESFRSIYGNVNGKLVGLSTGVNSYNVMINKNVLDRLNIAMPSQSITWDEFLALGRKIHKADPNSYLLSADKDSLNLMMRSFIRQRTGKFYIDDGYTVLEDEGAYVAFFTMLRTMYDDGIIEPVESGFPYWGKLEQNKKWIQGQIAAMYCAASSILGIKQADMNIVPINLPQTPGSATTGIVTQPAQIFAVKKGPNQDEALRFLAWLYTTEEGALIVKDTRGVPPTQFQRSLLAGKGLLDKAISAAVDMAMPKTDKPVPALSENSQIYEVCQGVVEKVAFKVLGPEQAAKELIAKCKVVLADLKSRK